MYVVVSCQRCNNLLLGNTRHRTRACPHCGHRMVLRKRRVLARTESPHEAVAMIQELKKRDVEET
jgi:DNA-directed RNA polymerase subunit RPC12/RpoP